MKEAKRRSPRIAIVEDDTDLRKSIEDYLIASGYQAWSEPSAEAFYKRLHTAPVDIVILDIGLPGENGFAVARYLNDIDGMETIILSGRGTVEDRLQGLREGANRYLVKPVDLQELIANIEACQRSRIPLPAENEWQLIRAEWALIAPGGARMELTSSEWIFMQCLFENVEYTVSRTAIATALHGPNLDGFDYHRIDMIISRLRSKIFQATGSKAPIKTIQNRGFTFMADCHTV